MGQAKWKSFRVGMDESDKCFFCLGLQCTHKCSRAAAHDPGSVGTLARVGEAGGGGVLTLRD